jgi:hypothetical protein
MRTLIALLAALICASAQAQQKPAAAPGSKPPAAAPSPDQLEPAVDTTAATTPAGSVAPKSDSGQAAAAGSGSGDGRSAPTAGNAAGAARGGARGPKGPDRVELETTEITGNRELPKVLYIVPWKRSDLGDLVGKPPNSLLDEVLQPIDRDVFLRQNRYYDAIKPDVAAPKAGAVPGSGDKP